MAEGRRRTLEQVSAAELVPLERMFEPAYPEQLRDVATVLFVELQNLVAGPAMPPERTALALTEALSRELGGGSWYMNKGHLYRLSKRDEQIVAEFTGTNLHLLARKHNLCETRLRQILKTAQAEKFERQQQVLPLDGEPA